ncbi:MAG: hypothetical protein AAGU74_08345 [Bacillota bacterium]
MKFMRKYAPPFVLLVVAAIAPTLTVYYLWPIVSRFEYSSWLTIIGLVILIHFEWHLWPILRDWVKGL